MIDVQSLTKKIDGNVIVQDVSFQVGPGEIMGFIGPNGAGKTTTLRMLACATAPTSGTARIAGLDLRTQDAEIRRILGYQPETPPLYPFMKVRDYLRFMASMRQIPAGEQRRAMDDAIDKCKLGPMTGREIGKLSKGYRQRVGLAQALLASPKILLLDEPTASLDPGQINETRSIIRNCATDAAVIFSTHIMQEVQHLCNRIVVIRQGRVRYAEQLRSTAVARDDRRSLVVRVRVPAAGMDAVSLALASLQEMDGVRLTMHEGATENSADNASAGPVGTDVPSRSSTDSSGNASANPVDTREGTGSADENRAGNGEHIARIYAELPDDDGLQNRLLSSLLGAGIPVLGVMPRESELEQTILHYMKN